MALEIKQQLRLSQQLVMTPQLQQAIKLLQLSRLELIDMVREEMMENPILEDQAEAVNSIFTVTGFSNTQMQRITFAKFIKHCFYQQTISLNHYLRVAALHAQHNVVVMFKTCNAQKFHRTFHHSHWCIAIAAHNAIT